MKIGRLSALAYVLTGIVAVSGGLCSTETKSAANSLSKPILSCDTYSLRDYFARNELDFISAPAKMKELHIPGIAFNDIWMESYEEPYLDKIKAACAQAGVKITALICGGNLATTNDEAWEAQIAENRKKLKAAAYLGAPVVRFDLGGLGSDELDSTVGIRRCIAAFKRLIPLAKALNVKMSIENHGGVSRKADWILEVIKGSDRRWVGACLDFGNWPTAERNIECTKLAPYAYHVHAKTHRFNADGEDENKDYNYLLGLLKAANYKYAVSIEYEGSEDQILGVSKSRDLILKHWPELAR